MECRTQPFSSKTSKNIRLRFWFSFLDTDVALKAMLSRAELSALSSINKSRCNDTSQHVKLPNPPVVLDETAVVMTTAKGWSLMYLRTAPPHPV